MNITTKQLDELEAFFNSVTIPQVMKPNPAITYKDAPRFIKENLALLKNNELKGLPADVRFVDLLHLKKALEENPVEKH